MSDTPRTDAAWSSYADDNFVQPLLEHARQLERELAEARKIAADIVGWDERLQNAVGVEGCHPEEILNVIDGMREDEERYRWLRKNPAMFLHLSYNDFDAAIDAARKKKLT